MLELAMASANGHQAPACLIETSENLGDLHPARLRAIGREPEDEAESPEK